MFGSRSFLHRQPLRVLLTSLIFTGMAANGAPPAWWSAGDPPVWDETRAEIPGVNKGVANIGQAKHMVQRALETLESIDEDLADEIRTKLTTPQPSSINPSQTNPAVLDLAVPSPKPPEWIAKQKAPLLIGQLKAIAAPFYKHLNEEDPLWLEFQLKKNRTKDLVDASNIYPWTSAPGDDQNKAVATIGQLKAVFSLQFESFNLDPAGDEDGDGFSNGNEAVSRTDPLDPLDYPGVDSDGDGVPNTTETENGTDPDDADDFPVVFIRITKNADGNSGETAAGNPTPYSGTSRWSAQWTDEFSGSSFITSAPATPAYFSGLLQAIPFPSTPPTTGITILPVKTAYPSEQSICFSKADGSRLSGDFGFSRIWIKAPASTESRSFKLLKIASKTSDSFNGTPSETPVGAEFVEFVIPANQTLSNSVDLEPVPATEAGIRVTLTESLLPVEVRGYATGERNSISTEANEKYRHLILEPADYTGFKTESKTELKIVQWGDNDIFDPNNNGAFVHEKFKRDVDIFRIRLPDIAPPAGTAEHQIKIWTVDAQGGTLDPGAVVDLNVFDTFHETAALGLVADDETDDNFPVEGKADGALGDRTYRAKLGGKLKFQWLTFPGTGEKPTFEIPIRVKKVVTAKGFLLKGTTDADTAKVWFERAKKIYSAIGVDLQYSLQTIDPLPAGVTLNDGFDIPNEIAGDLHEMRTETKALMDHPLCQVPLRTIPVFIVNNINSPNENFLPYGVTNTPSYMAPGDEKYGGAIFITSTHSKESALAHELAHVLLDAQHAPSSNALWNDYFSNFDRYRTNIWFGNQGATHHWLEDGIGAHRRLADTMRSRIWKSPFAKNP